MSAKLSVKQIDVEHKRVFLRVDFNVPMSPAGEVVDDTRIRASLPTIQYLLERNARLIIGSHLGRPKKGPSPELSLRPVAAKLGELLGRPVQFAEDCIGEATESQAKALKPGEILLLENLRFHPEEEKNAPDFSKQLAALAEVYVNDAFGTAHRAHASTEGVTHFLSPCAAGLLIDRELEYLGGVLTEPKRPALAILGGAKISSKISVMKNLMQKVDAIAIGGGMAFTFLKARGSEIGDSLFEPETLSVALEILGQAENLGRRFLLPVDCVVTQEIKAGARTQIVNAAKIPAGWKGVDIGPETIANFKNEIAGAGTVIWNGPVGISEIDEFAAGTREIARSLAKAEGVSILGGGETAAAAEKFGVADQMTHVSTGGGASLEFLEGRELPGIAALDDAG